MTSALAAHISSPISYYNVDPVPTFNQVFNSITGEYLYSYSGSPSVESETTGIRGSYSYLDGNHYIQQVNYVVDPKLPDVSESRIKLLRKKRDEVYHVNYLPFFIYQTFTPVIVPVDTSIKVNYKYLAKKDH